MEPPPKVCVCICTFRRPLLLLRCLQGVVAMERQGRFSLSIVVVDNDSQESARDTVVTFRSSSPVEILYIVEPRQNIALARNRALGNASGDYVAFIDDDEFPSPHWILALLKECEKPGVDGVLGPVRSHFDLPPPSW